MFYFHSQAASVASNEQIRNGDYCAVRWEDNSGASVVHQSSVRKPPDVIHLFEQRVIERDGRYRNAQIILKGNEKSHHDLLNLLSHIHSKSNIDTVHVKHSMIYYQNIFFHVFCRFKK